jgi:hypothetical protein
VTDPHFNPNELDDLRTDIEAMRAKPEAPDPHPTAYTVLYDLYRRLECPVAVDPGDPEDCANVAAESVRALLAAGLLPPEGAETRTEHEIEWRKIGRTRGGVQELTYWDLDEAALANEVAAAARLGREPVSHRWREVRTWGSPAYLTDGPRYVGPWVDAVRLAVGDSKDSVQDPSVSGEETP